MSLTTNKGIDIIALGSTGWGTPINDNSTLIDKALGSFTTVSGTSGSITLTTAQYQNMCLKSDTAAFFADVTFVIPSGVAGQWLVINQSAASSFTLLIKNAADAASIAIPVGEVQTVYSDGSTVFLTAPKPVSFQTFTSGTAATYTPTPGTRAIFVTCVGGGGGGGGVDGQGAGTAAAAGGGGGGGRTEILITSLSASYTYTVGAGGSGGAAGANVGSAGGTTTFAGGAVSLSAGGGGGGQGRSASSSAVAAGGGGSGTASGGSLNTRGATGFAGQVTGDGTTAGQGTGGSSAYGLGGAGDFVSGATGGGAGVAAPLGFGGGGGGASVATQTTNYAGGDGTGGLIIVEEFA
jgi:hypothetical protein